MGNVRHYQQEAVDRVMHELSAHKSVLLQMPTGAGKTRAGVEVVRRRLSDGPVWFLCHRKEIIRQTARAFDSAGIPFGIIAPWAQPSPGEPLQIASVQTLVNRDGDFPEPMTVIWDEAHHVAADQWARLMQRHAQARHVGLTATPERLDGKGLSDLFGALVCGPSMRWLIDGGYLSRFRWFAPTEPDLAAAKMSAGDYRKGDLDRIMNRPVIIGDAVEHYCRVTPGTRALVFAASVGMSIDVVEKFNAQGVLARHIDGKTPSHERDTAVQDFAAGRLKILSNVDVFTEGFDVPGIETVILLRPTKSVRLYLQMVGRGLRVEEGKGRATFLDHAGLVCEHGFPDAEFAWSLDGGARKARLASARRNGEVIRRCPKCSCSHAIAAECPECGYEYPSRREVGECDGVLYELRGGVPDGREILRHFAFRIGVSPGTISGAWRRRGLPIDSSGLVITADANEWLRENYKGHLVPPVGVDDQNEYMSPPDFLEFLGRNRRSSSLICNWRKAGMPCAPNGWVRKGAAIEWLKWRNIKAKPPHDVSRVDMYESRTDFAERVGVSQSLPSRWGKNGLPCASNGWVHIAKGLLWVQQNTKVVIPPSAWEGVDMDNGDDAEAIAAE